eukprot:7172413-Pyramimonas_sp.AAC.1
MASLAPCKPLAKTLAEAARDSTTLSAAPSALETAWPIHDHNLHVLTCRWARPKVGNRHSFASGAPRHDPATRGRA